MTPNEIRDEIGARGSTIAILSRAHGYARTSLGSSLSGSKRQPSLHLVIATFIGRTLHEVWPNLYPPGRYRDGRRTHEWSALYERILERVEAGETLRQVCSDPALPNRSSVDKRRRRDPAFSARLARAIARSPHTRRRVIDPETIVDRLISRVKAGEKVVDIVAEDRSSVRLMRRLVKRDEDLAVRWRHALGSRRGARVGLERLEVALDEIRAGATVKAVIAASYGTLRLRAGTDADFAAQLLEARRARRRSVHTAPRPNLHLDELHAIVEAATRNVPPYAADDVRADLYVALLSGEVLPEAAQAAAARLMTAWTRQFARRDISIDAQLGDGLTLSAFMAAQGGGTTAI